MGFVEGRLTRGYVGGIFAVPRLLGVQRLLPRFSGSYVNSTMFRIIGQAYSGDMPG